MAKASGKTAVTRQRRVRTEKAAGALPRTRAEPPLAILFRAEARPGKQQELLDFLKQDSRECQDELGTLRFDVLQDPATDRAFYVYEVYENADAFKAHKKGRAYERWSSNEFQTRVLADGCGFRKLADGAPLALMPRSRPRSGIVSARPNVRWS